MRRTASCSALFLVVGLLGVATARAEKKVWNWYGSWEEQVSASSKQGGSVEYMATVAVKLNGNRLTMTNTYGNERVARLTGTVTQRRSAAGREVLDVTFRPLRLAKTFAVSTGSLVEEFLLNAYHLPGGEVALGKASALLSARFEISGGGRNVRVRWSGTVDRYTPVVKAGEWQRGLRGKATRLMKDHIQQHSRPLRVKGSFDAL